MQNFDRDSVAMRSKSKPPNNRLNTDGGGFPRIYKHFAYAWLRVYTAPKQSPRPPQEQEMVKREIEPAADRQIDRCLCEPPLLHLGGEAISVLLRGIASGKEQERPRKDIVSLGG